MKKKIFYKISVTILLLLLHTLLFLQYSYSQEISHSNFYDYIYQTESISIKNVNGKFYAYIVLLFNENPHFVNLIQKDSIPLKVIANEGFHIKEFNKYLNSIKNLKLKKLAKKMMTIYLEPNSFNNKQLRSIERLLTKQKIILKFSKDRSIGQKKIILDYCIFGKKDLITIKHPLLTINEKIYNIQPYLYYDEFSTSNSTFYFNMIYINADEVYNDYLIAKKIINGEKITSMFFVGSPVTDNIKYCLSRAFAEKHSIRDEIWRMFVIHELTHKSLNNKYNYFDQITGEELSLCSTIYANSYLGLSVMYSYLNYNAINPHRIAAMNFVKFISNHTKKTEIIENPGLVKFLPKREIKRLAKEYFQYHIKNLN